MTYATEINTYIDTLDDTINSLGTLGAKIQAFADGVGTAKTVVDTIDGIGDYAETSRKAIDNQLTVLKLTKQAGPLKLPSKIFENVLKAVRPAVEKIEESVDKLNNLDDTGTPGTDMEGDFLERLSDTLDDVKGDLEGVATYLTDKAYELYDTRVSCSEALVALNHADLPDFDDVAFANLKAGIEGQFNGRNLVTEPLGKAFNDIAAKVNGVLGLFTAAEFELVTADTGGFAEIAGLLDKIGQPLSVVASVLQPVEWLLDAVGFAADLVLGPIFDFISEALGIDKLLDIVADEIRSLLPDADFLEPLFAQVQGLMDDLRDFKVTAFGIDDLKLDIDARLYGASLGNALLGPTGFGTDDSEILTGDGGDDLLDGRGGGDNIYGQDGNDIILAGEGNDYVYGGDGTDMVYFDGYFQEYELAKEEGDDGKVIVTHVRPEQGTQNEGSTRLDSVERVVFRNISFTGKELEEAIIGGSVLNGDADGIEEDDLMFLNSSGTPNSDGQHVANGLGGDDRIFGSTAGDELNGGTGNDILLPGLGDDEANGDDGSDTYQVLDGPSNSQARIDLIDGTVYGPEGSDVLNSIENLIVQSGGDHVMFGDNGANNIISADGDDIVAGRSGDDVINTGAGRDVIIAGEGRDSVLAGDHNDFIIAAGAAAAGQGERFDGGKGADTLSYSKDFNVIRDFFSPEINAGNHIRNALNEIPSASGPLRIYADTGRINKLDDAGKVIATDIAVNVENFAGSDFGDILHGAQGDHTRPITIHGAGGDDRLYSDGARQISGGEGDDRMIVTRAADGSFGNSTFDGGSGTDVLDMTGIADVRWAFSLDGSISRSVRAFNSDHAGNLRSSGGIGSFNVESVEEFLLGNGSNLIDHNNEGSTTRIFRTGSGNDEMNHRGGFNYFYSGAGDDIANMREGGVVYAGGGDDRITFDDTSSDNRAYGEAGNDWITLERTRGEADGGAGFDTLAFGLENTAGNDYGYAHVDLEAGTALVVEKPSSSSFESKHVDAKITGFEQVIGTGFGDQISGSASDEKLIGGEGGDVLDGRGGNDQLFGGSSNDTLSGGEGDDKLHGGAGNDTLDGGAGRDTAVYSYAAPDGLEGVLTAGNFGGVTVSLLSNIATGSFGADTLVSIEDVFGSAGNDTLTGSNAGNVLSGDAGDDVLSGNGGNDLLITGRGTDVADGGAGNDQIIAGAGIKTVTGGAGTDTLAFGSETGKVTVDFASGSYSGVLRMAHAVWQDTGTTEARLFKGVELTPEEVKQTSALYADSSDDLARILPESGDPEAGLFRIADKVSPVASSGSFSGIEEVAGGAAKVNLVLSAGTDRYDGTASKADFLDLTAQNGGVSYNMGSGATSLALAANDELTGLEGVIGGTGGDRFFGDDENNRLAGRAGDDVLNGAMGADRLIGGAGSDKLAGGRGFDTELGGGGRDWLAGHAGNDVMMGGGGRDVLKGGNHRDRMDGGAGNDRLVGGKGADFFIFKEGSGFDKVKDFQDGRDAVNLKSWGFDSVSEALSFAENNGGGTLFDFGNGDRLLVEDTLKGALAGDLLI